VIDTGVDQNHPDLNVDTTRSVNFVSRGKYKVDDGNGHGTHVAGTIAAIDNTIGVIGVAAGATVVGVRVLGDNGSGSFADVIAGVDHVAAHGNPGDVANMSLAGGYSLALNEAVQNASANVKFAIAAGNNGANASSYSPASAQGANIYTVSAFANGDTWASFSNYGNPPIDCGAPGVSVLSTYKGDGYATLSGTSMAAPHVAGLLLLGIPATDGAVSGDPDGNPDPIAVHGQ
jgi:subtilisin family serine protease